MLLYLQFQVQFYIIAQTFLLILSLFLTFPPNIFRLLASHLHLSTYHQTLPDRLGLTKLRPITLTPGKKSGGSFILFHFLIFIRATFFAMPIAFAILPCFYFITFFPAAAGRK